VQILLCHRVMASVGQGFVNEGALVDAVPEDDIETAVAIKSGTQDD